MTVVFVGGVHGVGKSTCCAQVAQLTGCLHVTASEIIRRERSQAIASAGKLVSDVDGNQKLLIRGFHTVRLQTGSVPILLDGHFAMRDGLGEIQSVSVDVFRSLGIDRVVCLLDEPSAIAARIQQRDGTAPSEREIAELQDAESRHARLVAVAIAAPFMFLQGGDVEALRRYVPSCAP
ncbi:MAG TPA: ATP-binding protein [Ramlibacter sp.]|uniref:ATP-binding protein n=1 Tax=Ramlibacter sp. TaxID=1917967 RepID=UPI002ED48BE1